MNKKSYTTLFFSIIIVIAATLFKIYRIDGKTGEDWKLIINSDGLGYYHYLPAVFTEKNITDLGPNPRFTREFNGKHVNKYFVGTAVLISPFFGAGYGIAELFNYNTGGFSKPFQVTTGIASLFYLVIGLFFLYKILRLFKIDRFSSYMVVLFIFLGTNLLYYSVNACSMSHVYSFALISCFTFLIKKYFSTKAFKHLAFAAFVLGLIVITRPVNGIIILIIPFLAGSYKNLISFFLDMVKRWKHTLVLLFIFAVVVSIQPLLWYLQSGSFFVWSYQDEGFNFFHPQILKVLFSFRKGLFIYTPVIFVSLFGLVYVYRKSLFQFLSLLGFILVLIYIISSWWNWYYGDSFGLRVFIDFYAVFGILLGMLVYNLRIMKVPVLALLSIFVAMNLIQSYQYKYNIMHRFCMDYEKYKFIFLKTSKKYREALGGNKDMEPFNKQSKKMILTTTNDFEKKHPGWSKGKTGSVDSISKYGDRYGIYNKNKYGITYTISKDPRFYDVGEIFVEASLKYMQPGNDDRFNSPLFVLDKRDKKNNNLYYYPFKIKEIPLVEPGKWYHYHYSFIIPGIKTQDEVVKIYIWNKNQQEFMVDNFKLTFYKYH